MYKIRAIFVKWNDSAFTLADTYNIKVSFQATIVLTKTIVHKFKLRFQCQILNGQPNPIGFSMEMWLVQCL